MFRFIFNFIFFGLLFFLISHYFPDAFATMVGWVSQLFAFLQGLVMQLVEALRGGKPAEGGGEQALFMLSLGKGSLGW